LFIFGVKNYLALLFPARAQTILLTDDADVSKDLLAGFAELGP
jgi:hypothetical protein